MSSVDDTLAEASAELWAVDDIEAFRRRVLPVLRRLIAAEVASCNEISTEPPGAYVITDPIDAYGSATRERVEQFAQVIDQNPLAAHYRTGQSLALRMSDFISQRGGEQELLERARLVIEPLSRALFDRARLEAVLAALDAEAGQGPVAILLVYESGALHPAHGQAEELMAELARDRASTDELRAWAAARRRSRSPQEPLLLTLGRRELRASYVHGRSGGFDAIAFYPSGRPTLPALRELGLTQRQADVLRLVWEGAPNSQIALALSISEHTVRHHLEEIYRRLGVTSRAGAAHVAAAQLAER